jgi:hypothetical protein
MWIAKCGIGKATDWRDVRFGIRILPLAVNMKKFIFYGLLKNARMQGPRKPEE